MDVLAIAATKDGSTPPHEIRRDVFGGSSRRSERSRHFTRRRHN